LIVRNWTFAGTRELFEISVSGEPAGSVEVETKAAIALGFRVLKEAGFAPEHIVRSRLWARDAEARRCASDTRRTELAGLLRGASASFCHAERLPENSTMMIDLMALRTNAAADSKIIREYEPPIVPPQFVVLDGMVFLSGNTDQSPTFAEQLRTIRGKIEDGLRNAGASRDQMMQVCVFLSTSLDPRTARGQIAAEFGELSCPLEVTSVSGFSAPEKLVEIEVTADLN